MSTQLSERDTVTPSGSFNWSMIRAIARRKTETALRLCAERRIDPGPVRLVHRDDYRSVLDVARSRRAAIRAEAERAALPAGEQFCRALELEIWKRRNKLGPSDREHADDQRKIAEYEATIARVRAAMAEPVLQAAE